MHDEMEEAPHALASRNIASIEVLFDFIVASSKLHCDVIMALVHVFEDVLDSFDGGDALDVDVAMVLPDEIGTVSDHPAIVDLLSSNVMCLPTVSVPGGSIVILRNSHLIPERL